MKTRYFLFVAAALALAACAKEPVIEPETEPETEEQSVFDFGLTLMNDEYVAEVVLKGVGDADIQKVANLPAWISGITLKDERMSGNPVALVEVKSDHSLTEKRTAKVVLEMVDGKTVNLEFSQWPVLQGGENAAYKSFNTALEQDWSSAKTIRLVISNQTVNGIPEIHEEEVVLPWAWDRIPVCYLPRGDGRDETMETYKMVANKHDWSLIFNLTGINALPNYNYFGLYNKYTGILRIFYYFTKDMVPDNNTSDHLWSFSVNANLAEHVATQFALPAKVPVTSSFRTMAAKPILSTPNTDSYNPLALNGVTTPAIGWWAFDVNMSAYREHDFFADNLLNAFNINLCTYNEQNVLLNSTLQGVLQGDLQGKVNLEVLRPTAANGFCKAVSPITSTASSFLTNTYFLGMITPEKALEPRDVDVSQVVDNILENPIVAKPSLKAPATRSFTVASTVCLIVGTVLSLVTKYMDTYGREAVKDDDFGKLSGSLDLDLYALMTTQGTIGSSTTNKVPPASMSMDYIRKTNPDGTPTSLGKGVWNLDKHPVVYVVKDAYWCETQFNVVESHREYQLHDKDVYSYYLGASKGSRPGVRLISFLDPTSVEGVSFNEDLFDKDFKGFNIFMAYGVYPGSKPGYTDTHRKAEGLDYEYTWHLSEKAEFDSDKELNLIKKPHTDELFKWTSVPAELVTVIAKRLSSQGLRTDIPRLERRYYGESIYYSDPYATAYDVDQVQFVYDPQVYLPFDDSGHKLFDPQVPDYVVTATMVAFGEDSKDEGPSTVTNTLRFLPKIELISYKDLRMIYKTIEERKGHMKYSGGGINIWSDMEAQVQHIKDIVDAVDEGIK